MEDPASSPQMYDVSIDAFLIECFRSDAVLTVRSQNVEFVRMLMDPMPLIQTFAFSRLLMHGIDPEAAARYVGRVSEKALANQFDFEDAALAALHSPSFSL
jgi:hypothetical protein